MKTNDIKNMSKDELSAKVASLKEELGRLNYGKAIGQVDKPHRFRELRKTIARMKTILKEAERKG